MGYNYGNVTVKGITYTGKGSSSAAAVSSWTAPNAFSVYGGASTSTVDHTESAGQTLWLQYYYTNNDGSLATNPYYLGVVAGGGRWFTRDTAFPTGYNTVVYNAAGGSGAPATQMLMYGSTLTAGAAATRTGYTFAGWKSSKSGTVYAAGGTIPASEFTTYSNGSTPPEIEVLAQWTINTWTVAYDANGGTGTVASQTKTYGTDLTLRSSGYTRSLYTLAGWNTASDGRGTSYALGGTYSVDGAATMYAVWAPVAPSAPTSLTNTRNSDSRNTITWTNPDSVISTTQILRSVDGGSFSVLQSITGSVTSYVDTTTAANHAYAYQVKVTNATGSATSAASATTYNTPAAPTAITAARQTATTVLLTITNPANTATALEIQRSSDASTWEAASTVSGIVTSATDTPGGGTYYYRVRNTRGSLVSAWSPASNAVVTVVAPNAPTLVTPVSGAVISTATADIVFTWVHNPIDGSSQTAAQLQYSTDGGTAWTTVSVTTAQTASVANTFAVNTTVTWRVRTKGAAADYGPYSSTRQFTVYQQPSVSFVSPAGGSTITDMPISISLQYSDAAPSVLASAVVQIIGNGAVVYTVDLGSNTTASVTAEEFVPNNGSTYALRASVRSSSGLQAENSIDVAIDFVTPDTAALTVSNDGDAGTAIVQATIEQGSGATRAVSMNLYRVSSNGRVLLVEGLQDGGTFADLYAPLNVDYTYECVTFSSAGAIGTSTVGNNVQTKRFFFLWSGNVAYGSANPHGTDQLSRPEKVQVHYIGKNYPNSYDSSAVDDKRTVSFDVFEKQTADLFKQLVLDGGRCYYKSVDGDVFFADVTVSHRPNFRLPTRYGAITCNITHIQGRVV